MAALFFRVVRGAVPPPKAQRWHFAKESAPSKSHDVVAAVHVDYLSGDAAAAIGGGLFLIAKATHEIHREVEGSRDPGPASGATAFAWVVAQIVVVDLVFSIDSIITAIGTADHLEVMVAAVVIAMLIMYAASGPVGNFIAEHPTSKMLVLAFLVLIGVALIADGFDVHIPRGYIYFAMAFAAAVEAINVAAKRKRQRQSTASRM